MLKQSEICAAFEILFRMASFLASLNLPKTIDIVWRLTENELIFDVFLLQSGRCYGSELCTIVLPMSFAFA